MYIVPQIASWCKTVSTNQIDNSIARGLDNTVETTCGNPKYSVKKSDILDIGDKIEQDAKVNGDLYEMWKMHPDMRKYCCFDSSDVYARHIREIIEFGSDFHALASLYTTTELRKEVDRICPKDDPFCELFYALPIIDQVVLLPASKSAWTKEDELSRDIIYLQALILAKSQVSVYYSITDDLTQEELDNAFVSILNLILKYLQNYDFKTLKELRKRLPPLHAYSQTGSDCNSDNACIFMKIIGQLDAYLEQVDLYDNPVIVNGKKRLLLNTGTDYTEFLKQKQLDRILQVLTEQQVTSVSIANELKKHITQQFSELKSYYQHVESFNGDIAKADIGYINGRLDTFNQRYSDVVGIFKSKMETLVLQMIIGAGLEVANSAITLALSIAEAANPIGFIFGGADPKDLMDAITDVANAAAQLTRGIAVKEAWNNVLHQSTIINDKFKKNAVFLENVKILTLQQEQSRAEFEESKNVFLEQYNAYDPQVLPDELTQLTSYWSGLIEAACNVFDSFNTAAGNTAKAVVYGQNLCVDLPVLAERMGELYENTYDFQFDLMDALADYMRARVTMDAAKEINTEFTSIAHQNLENEQTAATLQLMGGLTFMTYKSHMLQGINHYCNQLEYMEGGVKPKECNGPKTDIALLVSNRVTMCTSRTLSLYQVPSRPSRPGDMGYIDYEELFKGATVNFKIPNSDWLVGFGWITEEEKDLTIFVEELFVYLPTEPTIPTHFRIIADPILHNEITPGGTEYMITPHTPLTSNYLMGPKRTYCLREKMSNPYTSCAGQDSSSVVCPLDTGNTFRVLYPSIYAQWAIRIDSKTEFTPPKSAYHLPLLVAAKLCKVIPQDFNEFDAGVVRLQQQSTDCCPEGQFRPHVFATKCYNCPKNTTPGLSGYYCQVQS